MKKAVLCMAAFLWLAAAVQAGAADKTTRGITAEEAMGRGYGPRDASSQETPAPPAPAVTAAPESPPARGYAFQGDSRRDRGAGRQPTRLTTSRRQPATPAPAAPGATPTPGWTPEPGQTPATAPVPAPSPAKTRGRGDQPPSMPSAYPISAPPSPRRHTAEPGVTRLTTGRQPTRLTTGRPATPATDVPGATPTPGWTPEPDQAPTPAVRPSVEPEPRPSVSRGYQFHSPSRDRDAARTPTRLTTGRRQPATPAPAAPGATPTPGWTPEPAQTSVAAPGAGRAAEQRRRGEKRVKAADALPAAAEAVRPAPRGRNAAPPRQTRLVTRDTVLVPATDVTPAVLEEEMVQAYHLFDSRYQSALGKTRQDLSDMWGFPMETMGTQDGELAVGFRQRGTIIKPEVKSGATRNVSYYASTNTAQAPADGSVTPFSCLVVFWIDQDGEGKVVNGDAVGDCFVPESLQNVPVKYER